MLVLTWIKGEALPTDLVDDILKAIGLERETPEERRSRRTTSASDSSARFVRSRSSIERQRDDEPDVEDGDI